MPLNAHLCGQEGKGVGSMGERGLGERVSERKEKTREKKRKKRKEKKKTKNNNRKWQQWQQQHKSTNKWRPRLLCFAVELGHTSRIYVPTAGPTKRGPRVACRQQEHSASRQQKALFTAINPSERAPPTSLMRSWWGWDPRDNNLAIPARQHPSS